MFVYMKKNYCELLLRSHATPAGENEAEQTSLRATKAKKAEDDKGRNQRTCKSGSYNIMIMEPNHSKEKRACRGKDRTQYHLRRGEGNEKNVWMWIWHW